VLSTVISKGVVLSTGKWDARVNDRVKEGIQSSISSNHSKALFI
jgi:hypothetical protein